MNHHMEPSRRLRAGRLSRRNQQGLATLIVVAVLFFLVSLAAAYANRNLIFEQRTSANQFRSTLAFETAEAGIEWAVAMLNNGLVNATCAAVDNDGSGTQTSFRQRYLQVDLSDGRLAPVHPAATTGSYPTCVANGGDWQCDCPATGQPSIANPPTGVLAPAFRVRMVQRPVNRSGTVWLEVNACTALDEACLRFPDPTAVPPVLVPPAPAGDARARAEVMLVLRSALPSPPVAALTARGNVDFMTPAGFTVANPSRGAAAALAVHTGGAMLATPTLSGAPGEPVDASRLTLQGDDTLALSALAAADRPDRFFGRVFGALPTVYAEQPAVLRPDCGAACTADDLRAALRRNPGRVLWVDRDVTLDSGVLGTPEAPVFLVIEGPTGEARTLTMNGNIQVHGLIYARTPTLTINGDGALLRGGVVAEGDFSGGAGATGIQLVHDADVLSRLHRQHGSFVRVPGSWRDY